MIAGSSKPLASKLKKVAINAITGCHEWTGCKDKDGYGRISGTVNNSRWVDKAHRKAYELKNGSIPDGAHILHHCDNTCCINPEHLYAGTPADNGRDKAERGRARTSPRFGKDNPMFGKCGPLNHFYGKTHTAETKRKISATKRGVKL